MIKSVFNKKEYMKEYQQKNKEKIKIRMKQYRKIYHQTERYKELLKIYTQTPEYKKRNRDRAHCYYRNPENKARLEEYTQSQRYKELRKVRRKRYHQTAKYKAYAKARRQKEEYKKWLRAYTRTAKFRTHLKNRFKTDMNYRLRLNMRIRIKAVLKGLNKSQTTMNLIGCSIEYLKNHLESQFKPGMSWENYSLKGWHVDHIIPCAKFDLNIPEHQKACFNYTNLQPLWAKENLAKNNKLLILYLPDLSAASL